MTRDANLELTTTAHDDWIRATYKREPTDRDRRFFALRDGGYTGWIDQDGSAVYEDGTPIEEFKLRSLDIGHDCTTHNDVACPGCGHCRWRHHGKQGCDHGWTGISEPCPCIKDQDDKVFQ